MPSITRLQLSRRRKDRVHVHLDHEYAFSLPLELAASLRKGQDLTADDVAQLRGEDSYRHALDRALGFLGYRPRSRDEVAGYLTRQDTPEGVAERVLTRLTDLGLIDDRAFAEWWVENRLHHQPRGPRALRHELAVRGVSRAIISAAIEGIDEEALATEVALGRASRYAALDHDAFRRRLGGFLRRRGFGAEPVRSAVNEAWSQCGTAGESPFEIPHPGH